VAAQHHIAVLIACHNRRSKTLRCLAALHEQHLPEGVGLVVTLVDDGSTDGTGSAVAEAFPDVTVLRGGGSLFWSGAMRRAFDHARQADPSAYLWLNDDVTLAPGALAALWRTHTDLLHQQRGSDIVVGTLREPGSDQLSYGGQRRAPRRGNTLNFERVPPDPDAPVPCDTMNGNLVLLPRGAVERVGHIDPLFTHGMGDYDLGLRARRQGVGVWVAPGVLGECAAHVGPAPWRDRSRPLTERWRLVCSPLGRPPRERWRYAWRHGGRGALRFFFTPYLQALWGR